MTHYCVWTRGLVVAHADNICICTGIEDIFQWNRLRRVNRYSRHGRMAHDVQRQYKLTTVGHGLIPVHGELRSVQADPNRTCERNDLFTRVPKNSE